MGIIERYDEQINQPQYEGDFIYSGLKEIVDNNVNQSGAVVPIGLAAVWVEDTESFQLPKEAGQSFAGIFCRADIYPSATRDYGNGITLVGYPAEKIEIPLANVCHMNVWCETAFSPSSTLYFRHTANGAGKEVPGRFRTDADTDNCEVVPTAKIWNKSAVAGLAHISIRI